MSKVARVEQTINKQTTFERVCFPKRTLLMSKVACVEHLINMQMKFERVVLANRALLMSKVARVDNDIKSICQTAGATHLARYYSSAGCGWC